MKNQRKHALTLIFTVLTFGQVLAQDPQNFETPPDEAKPRVWWHWMNGNVTKEGIKKDLVWMKETGIGGFQNFDANLMTPDIVSEKLVFMTPKWKEAFKFTTDLASEKDLEMAIAGSPGWSVTGGPWVAPEDGMKKYVWTETIIEGGKKFSGKISSPPSTTGSFQNVASVADEISGGDLGEKPTYYQDALVVAYRLPASQKTLTALQPIVSSSGGDFNVTQLTDGDLNTGNFLPPKEIGEEIWIQYEFKSPQTFQALSIVGANHSAMEQFRGSPENRSLKVSDDGITFREVASIHGTLVPQASVSFPPTTAKYFRFSYETLPDPGNPFAAMMGGNTAPPKPQGVSVAEFVLYTSPRIDKVEGKSGFDAWKEDTPSYLPDPAGAIAIDDVIDLTSNMEPDGTLNWDAPKGKWSIIRLGQSLTGRENHPASPEATGLEVDKLDKKAVRRYINAYLDMYKDATGDQLGAEGLGFMVLDSYEAGHMNWTSAMPQEFNNRRGYSIIKWLPVLTGKIVESTVASEKFLWDFRKTIGEMIVDNHYEVIGEELHKRGMKRYTESHENGRIYLADGMDVKRNADIPMAAMWTPGSLSGGTEEEVRSEADIREAASVANIYGKPFIAAESMTSIGKPFQEHPEKLKRTADLELASGLNRFVIHTSVHQPLDVGPGFSLGPFGQYFSRLETWAGAGAKAWVDYLSRSSYLMQQGKNVADILYYYGENTNITLVCREQLPALPQGVEFDFVNSTILVEDISADNDQLVAPSGTRYKALVLDSSAQQMTLNVLKKIKGLQDAGIPVAGTRPEESPSLGDNAEEFEKIASEVGSKMLSIEALNLTPDIEVSGTDHEILFRHRKTEQSDIYWLNHRNEMPTQATISFNVDGKTPKLWNAETGRISDVSYTTNNGRTEISFNFKSWDAVFVVFEKSDTASESHSVPSKEKVSEQVLNGPWTLSFDGKAKQLDQLTSWTEAEDTKYFSGTATYSLEFKQKKYEDGESYRLHFSDVDHIAEVILNGKDVGVIWKKPYEIDVSEALKKGTNELEIKVTNTWVNALIGDAQPGVAKKSTFTTMPFYQADAPLTSSGLLGEVLLINLK